MTKHESYENRTEQLVLPILAEQDLQLVDVEFVKEAGSWFLRIYIDREGGVSIDDCEAVTRAFVDILDREEYIEETYTLEVSSPGLGRAVKKDKDYQRNLGKELEIRLFRSDEKEKEFVGSLLRFTEDRIVLRTKDGTEKEFERKNLAMVREYVDWNNI